MPGISQDLGVACPVWSIVAFCLSPLVHILLNCENFYPFQGNHTRRQANAPTQSPQLKKQII